MKLPYTLSGSRPTQVGLIVLQADETLERDMRHLLPASVDYLVTRVPSAPLVTSETLSEMADVLTRSAALFPAGANLSVVGYGCTSGTAEIGADRIAVHIRAGVSVPQVTEPVSALVAACRSLGIARIGMISPYIASVSARLCQVLEDNDIHIAAFASFEEAQEAKVARIAGQAIRDAVLSMAETATCDAIFLSCTNLRVMDLIADLEAEIGMPILSSNQVLAWHLCRLAEVTPSIAAPGRLFKV